MGRTEEAIDSIIEAIEQAEHHIHMIFYIFEEDQTGRRVAEALQKAARRGVQCRVLVDAVGSWSMLGSLDEQMRHHGVEIHAALPVAPWRRKLARMDLRNHSKLVVVDGKIAFSGSQNIVNPSYGTKNLVWLDVMVRLRGPVVAQLQILFIRDWYYETEQVLEDPQIIPDLQTEGDVAIQALPSGPTYPSHNYQKFVVSAIHAARRQLIITTPYFVPDESILEALEAAAIKGVNVELIVPRRSDHLLPTIAGRAFYEDLLEHGVRIYLHERGLLHSKTMTVDDEVTLVGSGNFDIRSFYLNFELNLLFYGPQFTGQVRALQRQYMNDATEIDLGKWQNRSAVIRIFENSAKLLGPLL